MVKRVAARMAVLIALVAVALVVTPITASAATEPRMAPYRTWIEFKHFQVKTVRIDREGGLVYVWVKICVRSNPYGGSTAVRVSNDPWAIYTDRRRTPRDGGEAGGYRQPLFPNESRVEPGNCRAGWLEFWVGDNRVPVDSVEYSNSLGDSARWTKRYAGFRDDQWWGQYAEFKRNSVVVQKVERTSSYWVNVKVRQCTKSAPGLSARPMQIGIDQWKLRTTGGMLSPIGNHEGSADRYPRFPRSMRLDPGKCRTGWIEFWKPSGGIGKAVEFRHPNGANASWYQPH